MKAISLGRFGWVCLLFLLAGCGGSDNTETITPPPPVEVVLDQGPVKSWRIPIAVRDRGKLKCRYATSNTAQPSVFDLNTDSLTLTTVDQGGRLTLMLSFVAEETSGTATVKASQSLSFKCDYPEARVTRETKPMPITMEAKEQTFWKKSWESSDSPKVLFFVELTAFYER